jgi:sugar/nucleoside kinase (ribokinase family)
MKITVLGTATLDIILDLKENFHLGSKIEILENFFTLGGGALNASKTFQNLNLDYLTYIRLGKNDLIGKTILDKIKKEKFKIKIFFHEGNSQFSIVLLLPNQERTILVYRGLSDHFSLKELNQIQRSDFYYLTTANTKSSIFKKFLIKIKNNARLIALNPSKNFLKENNVFSVLKLTDILFLNHEEIITLLNKNDKPLMLGKELYNKLKIKILVLTLGDKGSLTFYEDKVFIAGIFVPKKYVDTTGAGDAFASAFFGSLILNKDINEKTLKQAIIFGSANASKNIEKFGAQIGLLKKNEFYSYLRKKFDLKVLTL